MIRPSGTPVLLGRGGGQGTWVFSQESGWRSTACELHTLVMSDEAKVWVEDLLYRLTITGDRLSGLLDTVDPDVIYTVEVSEY